MNKHQLISIISLTASITLLAGCATRTTTNDNTNAVVTNSNENTNTEQASEVDTSDWLTYEDEKYASGEMLSGIYPKFTLRYPSDLALDETLAGPVFYTKSITSGEFPEQPKDFRIDISKPNDSIHTAEDCLVDYQHHLDTTIDNIKKFQRDGTNFISFTKTFGEINDMVYCIEKNGQLITADAVHLQPDFYDEVQLMVESISIEN